MTFLCVPLCGVIRVMIFLIALQWGPRGGLLTVWDRSEVGVWSSVRQEHVLQIHGRFIRTNEEFYLFNVYAPCGIREEQELWASLSGRLQLLRGQKVCACGNFNAV